MPDDDATPEDRMRQSLVVTTCGGGLRKFHEGNGIAALLEYEYASQLASSYGYELPPESKPLPDKLRMLGRYVAMHPKPPTKEPSMTAPKKKTATKKKRAPRKRAPKTTPQTSFEDKFATAETEMLGGGMSLFTEPTDASLPMAPGVAHVRTVLLSHVFVPAAFNARRVLWGPKSEGEDLETLAADIKERGLLEPIVVYATRVKVIDDAGPREETRYALAAGQRRFEALRYLGVDEVSAHVRQGSLKDARSDNAAENVQRKNLLAWEIATEAARLRDDFNMTAAAIKKQLRMGSSSGVRNYLRLYDAAHGHEEAWEAFKLGSLKLKQGLTLISHSRAALGLKATEEADPVAFRAAFADAWNAYNEQLAAEEAENDGVRPKRRSKPKEPEVAPGPTTREREAYAEVFALMAKDDALSDELRQRAAGAQWALSWVGADATVDGFLTGAKRALSAAMRRASHLAAEERANEASRQGRVE